MDTKQQIITYAMSLLKQTGYHGWSYDHISKKVGIRKASIHYYFPTKALLVAEILKIYINDLFLKLEIISKSECTNYEKLQQLVDCYRLNYDSPHEICLCTILASDYQMLPIEIGEQLKIFYKKLNQWICTILRQGIIAKEFNKQLTIEPLAAVIVHMLQGLLITSKLSSEGQSFKLCMQQLDQLLK